MGGAGGIFRDLLEADDFRVDFEVPVVRAAPVRAAGVASVRAAGAASVRAAGVASVRAAGVAAAVWSFLFEVSP
jgi:hypothetical protein